MSVQRIFSVFCCVVALLGINGALKVPLVINVGPGPGLMPLIYSTGLLICGLFIFFSDKSSRKFNFRASLLTGVGGKAFVFFLLNFLLLLLLYAFGPFIAILVFSILTCFVLKRQTPRNMILFSIINTFAIYYIFVVLFKISFQRGLVFRMLGWSI